MASAATEQYLNNYNVKTHSDLSENFIVKWLFTFLPPQNIKMHSTHIMLVSKSSLTCQQWTDENFIDFISGPCYYHDTIQQAF